MGHKLTAQKYKCFAEFRSFDNYLLLAFVMSFLGFVFVAPGAVMISGRVTKRTNGIISAAGPSVNFVLAILFLIVNFIVPNPVSLYGIKINAFLGLFNMIPVWMFDGKKIWNWDKRVWSTMLVVGLILIYL